MSYKEIKKTLEDNDYTEVIKAIFSFDLNIEDEKLLNDVYEYYWEEPMSGFLDESISSYVESKWISEQKITASPWRSKEKIRVAASKNKYKDNMQ